MSRVVVVTGATGGVGRGIALACGDAGWTVWIAARRAAEGNAVADEVDRPRTGTDRFVRCEAGDPESVHGADVRGGRRSGTLPAARAMGNATSGLSPRPGGIGDITLADLRDHVRGVPCRGTYLLAREALPHLEATVGALVVLTSEAGFEGKARLPAYSGVKAAQRGLVRALAREWGPKGRPGETRWRRWPPEPSIDEAFQPRSGHGRAGARPQPDGPPRRRRRPRSAPSPASSSVPTRAFMTGVTLTVDGGSCSIS